MSHSMEARRGNGLWSLAAARWDTKEFEVECPFSHEVEVKPNHSRELSRSSRWMTMHEDVHELVVGECHEPNSQGRVLHGSIA